MRPLKHDVKRAAYLNDGLYMTDIQQSQDVLIALRKIIRATDIQSKRIAKSCGLTIPQVMVLRAIGDLGDVTVKRLSESVSLSQATVTTILNRLEQRGLAVRVRSVTDKRKVNARLTEEGASTLGSVPPLLHERFEERFSKLSEAKRFQLVNTLQDLAQMMDAEAIDASPFLDLAATANQ